MTAVDSLALLAEAEALDKAATPGPWTMEVSQDINAPGYYVEGIDRVLDALGGDKTRFPLWDNDGVMADQGNAAFIARARTLLPALAAALRPFTAPVGVEAFEGLRREHDPGVTWGAGCIRAIHPKGRAKCTCGADAHNTLLDQCIAAHVAALGEVERVKAEMATARMVTLPGWTEPMDIDHAIGVMEESANVRIAALRSAILDGPDPSGCGKCGSLTCDRKAAGEVAVADLPNSEYEAATERYRLAVAACESRPAVDWRAQLAKLREVAR